MSTVDAEIVNENRAVTVRQSMSVGQALSVEDIVAQVNLVQQVMRKVMTEGEHYGTVPGCGTKKVLLQPGAQKLTMTFRLCPEYEIQETELPRGHKEYRVICTLKSMGSGGFVGQGVGCCSSMESKYRWRGGARKCPECGKETIIKGKAEYGGGWLCFGKKGGCGAKWTDGAQEIESQNIEKIENENPADSFNTVLKMAKKRAFVDATITATAASDIFTQDILDTDEGGEDEPKRPQQAPKARQQAEPEPEPEDDLPFENASPSPKSPQDAPKAAATPSAPKTNAQPKPAPAAGAIEATEEQKAKLLTTLDAEKDGTWRAGAYFIEIGALMPNEVMSDLPLRFVPRTVSQMRELGLRIAAFHETGKPEKCVWFFEHSSGGTPKASETSAGAAKPRVSGQSAGAPALASKPAKGNDTWWRAVIVPVPRKGQKRDAYLRSPDTIGSLFDQRHGNDEESQAARQRLWGFVTNYEPKGWVKRSGEQMPPSDGDIKFRAALDAFADWFERNHPDEKL